MVITTKMEFAFPSMPLMPVLLSFLLFVFMVFITSKQPKTRAKNLPPGPWKLPIIGNIHNLLGSSLPHHTLYDLSKKYGPLMHLQLGEVTTIVISSPETAKQVLKTHDLILSNRPFNFAVDILNYGSDLVFAPYGDYWRQVKKVCVLELLSAKRVQSFRSIREDEVLKILRLISDSEGSVINFSKILFSYTNSVISRAAFGKITKETEAFVPHMKEIVEVAAGFKIIDLFPSLKLLSVINGFKAKLERLNHAADRILETIINDHKARKMQKNIPKDKSELDLVDVLLNLQDGGDLEVPLSANSIKAIILDMFVAGSDTVSTTIEWVMTEMLKNPRVMEKAQTEVRQVFDEKGYVDESRIGELKYLKLVIKEALRFHPPVPLLIPRESRDECEINGYHIPKNTQIIINDWALGRDPNYWNEADKFNPERFSDGAIDYKGNNYEFIPFGGGRRICPGITFATANIELPLASLLYHFDWKLSYGMKPEELDTNEAYGAAIKRENDLNLIPILSRPLCVA